MLQRLHTRIVGLGAVCGLHSGPMREVVLRTLPCSMQVDNEGFLCPHSKLARDGTLLACQLNDCAASRSSPQAKLGPLYDFVCGGAGRKCAVLATRTGLVVVLGEPSCIVTLQSQSSAVQRLPIQQNAVGMRDCGYVSDARQRREDVPSLLRRQCRQAQLGWSAVCIEPDVWLDAPSRVNLAMTDDAGIEVSCGANFTLVYQRGTRSVAAFGCDNCGQLGAGHAHEAMVHKGVVPWDAKAAWWPSPRSMVLGITCGFHHAVVRLSTGELYAFGENTSGALGIGSTNSPLWPTQIAFFSVRNLSVCKVACGKGFTIFLTDQGYVYGCGSAYEGQLPRDSVTPIALPIARHLVHGSRTCNSGEVGRERKLLRIKNIACIGSMAVYVSVHDEIFVQGSFAEYGVHIPAPRLRVVGQAPTIAAMRRAMKCGGDVNDVQTKDGFVIDELVSGPSSLLVRYRNGCIAGLGANTEGQLHYDTRVLADGGCANVAPAFAFDTLLPVLVPLRQSRQCCEALSSRIRVIPGMDFTLVLDSDGMYTLKANN